MDDIRQRYEAVVRRVDEAKQKNVEAKAERNMLNNRLEELAKEAAALGVSDLDLLDETIESLEEEIQAELTRVEEELAAIESGGKVEPPPVSQSDELEFSESTMDLDDLLAEGGAPQRKQP